MPSGRLLVGASGGRQVRRRLGGLGDRARELSLAAALAALLLGGCDGSITSPGPAGGVSGGTQGGGSLLPGAGSDAGTSGPSADGGSSAAGADGGSSGTGSDGGVVVLSSELPCAAYDVLSVHCWSCHGATPSGGAPQSLATLAALLAPSPGYPSQSNGSRSVARMQDATSPMPPAPNASVPAAEVSGFQAWVTAGMAAGSCVVDGGVPPPPPDAGPPPAPDPLDAAPTCTSSTYWTSGTRKSPDMEPGHACISCHTQQGGPTFSVAGTVFPTGHEPDDCNGSGAGGAVVTVTDVNGVTATFTASTVSGNFHGSNRLTFPITAKVTFNGRTRAMGTAVSTGDCNSCHTQSGASSAPGRITLPP